MRRIQVVAAAALLTGWLGALVRAQEPPDLAVDVAPVELDGQVLFNVRGASSLTAETRAANIQARIEAVAADRSIRLESLRLKDADTVTWVTAGDRPLLAVVDADARLEDLTRSELAIAHLARIRQAIDEYRRERSPDAVRRGLRDAAVATVLFLAALVALFASNRWLRRLIEGWAARRLAASGATSLALVRGDRLLRSLHHLLQGLAVLVGALVVFQFLSYTLARFPATRGLSRGLLMLVLGPLAAMGRGIIEQLPNLAFLAVLFFVLRLVLRVLRGVFEAVGRGTLRLGTFEPEWATPTYKIVRLAVIAFGVVVAYPYLPGSESEAFKGVTLFVGVLFSLGSTSAVSNFVAGYLLIYRRTYRLGDVVRIGDVTGKVIDFRIQVTRLCTFKNEEIVVPNAQILSSQVTNYTSRARKEGVILHTEVGIGYETPWRQVEAMLLAAAARTPGILPNPAPFVLQRALADFAITYELNVYCDDAWRMLEVSADLHRQVLDVFNEYGVQIMTPAYMADPAQPKVVPPGQWHLPPAEPATVRQPSADAGAGSTSPASS